MSKPSQSRLDDGILTVIKTSSPVLEIACREAEHVLLDRAYIAVGEVTFANFCQMLDSPPASAEGLRKLMQVAPWA